MSQKDVEIVRRGLDAFSCSDRKSSERLLHPDVEWRTVLEGSPRSRRASGVGDVAGERGDRAAPPQALRGPQLVPVIGEAVDRLGPTPEPDAVLAMWAENPSWRHLHPQVEWTLAAGGPLGTNTTGPAEIARWWAEWLEVWESYVYRAVE